MDLQAKKIAEVAGSKLNDLYVKIEQEKVNILKYIDNNKQYLMLIAGQTSTSAAAFESMKVEYDRMYVELYQLKMSMQELVSCIYSRKRHK